MRVTDGLDWLQIFWTRGTMPKHCDHKNAVVDPPCSGWQHAFVMPGEKRSTIFCPYTLGAFTVPNACAELVLAEEPTEFRSDHIQAMLKRKWDEMQRRGWQRDYDVCALVMRKLGMPVPAQIMTGGGEDVRKKGGKDVGTALLKPVKAGGKRGRFLQWFLDGDSTRSVREAMAEFAMTRSNVLSYLFMLKKDHGIGYELVGDLATITLPNGCSDPFNVEQPSEADDDAWLC